MWLANVEYLLVNAVQCVMLVHGACAWCSRVVLPRRACVQCKGKYARGGSMSNADDSYARAAARTVALCLSLDWWRFKSMALLQAFLHGEQ